MTYQANLKSLARLRVILEGSASHPDCLVVYDGPYMLDKFKLTQNHTNTLDLLAGQHVRGHVDLKQFERHRA